jgi:LuxR family maltose regulon positive regulatory protein
MVPPRVTGEFVSDEFRGPGLLLTRLAPPPRQSRVLRRPRVETRLSAALDYPICLVIAPAGSGKTTALAELVDRGGWPVAWCRASSDDTPALFVRHLAAACHAVAAIDDRQISAALEAEPEPNYPGAVDALLNELAAGLNDDTVLVIDDYHLVDARPDLQALIARFILAQPLRLHLVLASRRDPTLADLQMARLRGELIEIGMDALVFDLDEARALAVRTGHTLPADDEAFVHLTRGWPLAIQAGLGSGDWRALLGLGGMASSLDIYFEREVLADLPEHLRDFLFRSAGLRWIDLSLSPILAGTPAEDLLAELHRYHLFIEQDDSGYLRYQPVFHAFLERKARAQIEDWHMLHRRFAEHYRQADDLEGVLHHLIAARDPAAADALVEFAPAMVAAGEPEQVLEWLRCLSPEVRDRADLFEMQATALRHLGRFDAALIAYREAKAAYAHVGDIDGSVRALCGQADVYLDTVQPAPATDLLKQALKLIPRDRSDERAAIVRMQAENWANRGRADVALMLEQTAIRLESGAAPLRTLDRREDNSQAPIPPRLLLRSGRLNEARQQLESLLWVEHREFSGQDADSPRVKAHREPLLLLSLIYAMLGSSTRALAMARRGVVESQQGASRLTEAIAELRLGHAYQLVTNQDPGPAAQRYAQGLRMIQQLGVSRTRAEGYLGLVLLHGHAGDLAHAEADAREGLQITEAAGDEWVAALILLALGGAAVSLDDSRADEWLEGARRRFVRGGDTFGMALVDLWTSVRLLRNGGSTDANPVIDRLFHAVAEHGYEGVLVAPSMFGPRDMALLVPVLLRGRSLPDHADLAQRLLRQGFPTIAADDTVEDYHPGFTLRVQMLGTFRIWRGTREIQAREWQREKARQLFQLLLTYRGTWLQREQICVWLWPDADMEAAERQFKVTLNALNTALEPGRPPRVAPFFIRRQGLAYSFAPSYGVWIDVDEFELRVAGAAARDEPDFARHNAQIAVQLYRGDYLAEMLYDPWTTEERERLLARYLLVSTTYAEWLSELGEQPQAVQICEQVIRRDRCYEEAYQVLMRAHARAGSRSQALRSYSRCVQALRDDLGIEPLPETTTLYEQIKRNEAI